VHPTGEKFLVTRAIGFSDPTGFGSSGTSTSSQIASWVSAHFTAKAVDRVTIYDLTAKSN